MAKIQRKSKEEKLVVSEEKQFPDTLHSDHLLKIETASRDIEINKLRMATEEQNLRNLLLEMELLKVKIEKKQTELGRYSQAYQLSVQRFSGFKKEIWPVYGIELDKPLNYDAISGKIVHG